MMKKILLIFAFLFSISLFSQNYYVSEFVRQMKAEEQIKAYVNKYIDKLASESTSITPAQWATIKEKIDYTPFLLGISAVLKNNGVDTTPSKFNEIISLASTTEPFIFQPSAVVQQQLYNVSRMFGKQVNVQIAKLIVQETGTAGKIFFSSSLYKTIAKNDCGTGGNGGGVYYTVPSGKFSSLISQDDANKKAQNDLVTTGQTFANQTGVCYYPNIELSNIFTKNDCVTGGNPTAVLFTVPAGKYTSTVSQVDANSKAQNDLNTNGQANANSKGNCVFRSSSLDNRSYWKNNCSSGRGSEVKYTAPIGAFTSNISQADANAKVFAAGQENANRLGTCNNMPSTPRY